MIKYWVLLIIAICGDIVGTSALKVADGMTYKIPVFIAALAFVISLTLLSFTLKGLPVAVVYAAWAGLGIVLMTAVSFVYFKQSLDLPAVLGIGLIMAGVIIINLFSSSVSE